MLAIVLPPIFAPDGERILKSDPSGFETHTVSGEVSLRLGVIPLEILILQYTAKPHLARMSTTPVRSRQRAALPHKAVRPRQSP